MKKQDRKAKIVCTIGPACSSRDMIAALVDAGMNVARLNFSHGDHDSHAKALENIRSVESEKKAPIAVMLDNKGPEIRTGTLTNHEPVTLRAGDKFKLFFHSADGDASGVFVDRPALGREVSAGRSVFIDDGTIALSVDSVSQDGIDCTVVTGGELGERKGINIPGADLKLPTLTEKDMLDLKWGVEHDVDYVAISFVRSASDIKEVIKAIAVFGGNTKIIAKVETGRAVENLDEILALSDGIMVARGDLGVEIATEEVPLVQKEIIEKCREAGKPVIVATQMLDSMIHSPRPTRAEASDVANAILDGTDAVMLSGETAGGRYPLESVKIMNRIVLRTEKDAEAWQRPVSANQLNSVPDAVSHAAKNAADTLSALAIISLTVSGATARMISKYRPKCPIVAATPSLGTWRDLSLVWGVKPVLTQFFDALEPSVDTALNSAAREGLVRDGDTVVITAGVPIGQRGSTNLLYVYTVGRQFVGEMAK